MVVLGSSASAPDVAATSLRGGKDRDRLQSLLTKAKSGELERRNLGRRSGPLRSIGGAPRSALPPKANAVTTAGGAEASRSPGSRLAPSPGPGVRGASSAAEKLPHVEDASAYVRRLVGRDSTGDGPLDWRLVQELDAVDGLLQEDQARSKVAAQRHALRKQLEEQRHVNDGKRNDSRDEKRRWGAKLQADSDSFWEEQRAKREAEKEAQIKFNRERADMLEVTKRKRLEEKEREVEMERQMHERSVMARRIEVARDEEKKKRAKAEAEATQQAREQAAVAKKERKREEAIRERTLIQMQEEQMDKQERERTERVEKMRTQLEKKMASFEVTTGNDNAEQERKSEERAKRQWEERIKKDFDQQQEKQLQMRQIGLESRAAIKSQLEERNEKRAKEREESVKLAKELKRDAIAAVDEEKAKIQERREKAKEHANFLLSQMQEKNFAAIPGRFGHERMNEAEKAINRDRLERANDPESLQLLFQNKKLEFRLAGSTMLGGK